MCVRAALPALLLLLGAWAGASAAAGNSRVDMRLYLPPSTVGWTTGWEFEDGSTETSEILSVTTVDGEKSVVTRTDASDGSFLETEVVAYNGGLHYGTITSVVAGGGGVVLPPREGALTRLVPLEQGIGRTYRSAVIRGDVLDYQTGQRIGRFVRRERATLGGFEDKATPGGSYNQALRQDWTADTRYFFTDRSRLRITGSGTYWFAAGQGIVARQARVLIYHNRVLESDTGMVDGWRVSLSMPAGRFFDLAHFLTVR